jgi:hypothetical protein
MKVVKKILNSINGLHYQQEYLCLDGSPHPSLSVKLFAGEQFLGDITHQHIFAGYCPLIITLYGDDKSWPPGIRIVFSETPSRQNENHDSKDAIAEIKLKKFREEEVIEEGRVTGICHYKGERADHRFLNQFHQGVISVYNRLYNRRQGNVFLHNNLYKQVQVAYSIPRKISLVTIGGNELFNLFPTDLHGAVGEKFYIDSLRHEGRAAEQLIRHERMIISEVKPEFYKTVYSLGKNHMQEMKTADHFPFSDMRSALLNLPVPLFTIRYYELELLHSFVCGIHRLFLLKIIGSQRILNDEIPLRHVHNLYASWRRRQGSAGNFLLR